MTIRWIEPKHSKTTIKKAGEILRSIHESKGKTTLAYKILSNWRSAHAYPMHAILIFLRKKSSDACKHPIVVQRLKRSPSIIEKLKRFPDMSLDRMQDIAGCRSVVENLDQLNKLYKKIKKSRIRHILHNEKNYIHYPKDSGYRCYHLIYKYNATKVKYKTLFIELQLRTQIQHAWATAVEVVGTFTNQALKASLGDTNWKKFFKYVSIEFARLERAPVVTELSKSDILSKIKNLETKLSVREKLRAFAVTTQHIREHSKKKYQYYLLILNIEKMEIKIQTFTSISLTEATEQYLRYETKYANSDKIDVVLVSVDSLINLEKAYPNYFADTSKFLSYYNTIFQ